MSPLLRRRARKSDSASNQIAESSPLAQIIKNASRFEEEPELVDATTSVHQIISHRRLTITTSPLIDNSCTTSTPTSINSSDHQLQSGAISRVHHNVEYQQHQIHHTHQSPHNTHNRQQQEQHMTTISAAAAHNRTSRSNQNTTKMLNNKSPLHMTHSRAKIRLGALMSLSVGALALLAGLLALSSLAEQQQHQSSDANSYGANPSTLATGQHQQQQQLITNDGYEQQQQQQQHAPSKNKKIQIVYIKVPLAKLKPSLNSSDDFATHHSKGYNSTSAASGKQQTYGANSTAEVSSTKTQGSQSSSDGDEETSASDFGLGKSHQSRFSHSSSLLIPMAVVQESNSGSSALDPASSDESQPTSATIELGRTNGAQLNAAASRNENKNNNYNDDRYRGSSSQNRLQMYHANSVWPELAAAFNTQNQQNQNSNGNNNQLHFGSSNEPMTINYNGNYPPRKSRANNQFNGFNGFPGTDNSGSESVTSFGLGHGFMSGFLSAEREKLNAMMQQQQHFNGPMHPQHFNHNSYHNFNQLHNFNRFQQQPQPQQFHNQHGPIIPEQSQSKALLATPTNNNLQLQTNAIQQSSSSPLTTTSTISTVASSSPAATTTTTTNNPITSSNSPQQPPSTTTSTTQTSTSTGANAKQTGGLLPMVVMPASEMPDNMIGQAYGAAVRQALPIESGSPGQGMLSTSGHPTSLLESGSSRQSSASSSASSYPSSGPQLYGSAHLSGPHSSKSSPGSSRGIAGDDGSYSPSSSPGSSFGPSHAHSDHSSSGSSSQNSGSGYSGSGLSSGFGSGQSSFGASVAFSDYPSGSAAQATHQPQQQHPAHQSQQQGASYNGAAQQQQTNYISHDGANMKLKQAKKTLIPIVVQVEHGILENNSLNGYGFRNQPAGKQQQQQQQQSYRPFAGLKRGRQINNNNNNRPQQQYQGGIKSQASNMQNQYQQAHQQAAPYSSASNNNEVSLNSLLGTPTSGAQFVNAANAQDINKITAAINAENAANAAAALAQADMAFGDGVPAYIMSPQNQNQQHHSSNHQHNNRPSGAASSALSQYASGLQSAASALFSQTHPMIQAAASNGIGSVSKLGAKLGEIMSMPSMQVPSVVNQLQQTIPVALSSWSTQVGAGLNQAVQQVAKEHPTAHAFARQIAQQAGLQLPGGQQQHQQHAQHQHQSPLEQQQHAASSPISSLAASLIGGGPTNGPQQQSFSPPGGAIHQVLGSAAASLIPQQALSSLRNVNKFVAPLSYQNLQAAASQMMTSGSSFLPTQMVPGPQPSLSQLRSSLGANLQTAAAQLLAASQKTNAQSAATLLQSPLSSLYPASVNAALKQLSGGVTSALSGGQSSGNQHQQQMQPMDSQHAQSSSLVPVQSSPDSPIQAHLINASPFLLAQQQQQNQDGSQSSQAGEPMSLASALQNQLTNALASGNKQLVQQATGLSSLLSSTVASQQQQQQQAQSQAGPSAQPISSTAAIQPGKSSVSSAPSSFKTKFFSYFQPPKFISNLLSWNERVGERQDLADGAQMTAKLIGTANDETKEEKQKTPDVLANTNENAKVGAVASDSKVIAPAA